MTPDLLDYLNVKLHVSNLKLRGRGAFGEVYAGEMKGLVHAFKISLDPLNAKLRKMADQELEFMMDQAIRDCSNIVQLRGWDWKNGHLITWSDLGEHSLADRLQKCADEGRLGLPPEELCRYLRDAAKAIDVVNDLAFRHRDIKPDNLLVFRDGSVRVADFGLVQFAGASTMSKSTAGTIEYIAPEALEGEDGQHGKLTRTADIYSLAATAIKLATGHGPFGETLIKIVDAKRDGQPVTAGLTASQTKAVRDALHPDPAQRPYKTAKDFVAAFLNENVVAGASRQSSKKGWMTGIATAAKRIFGGSTPSLRTSAQKHNGKVESEVRLQPATNPAVRQKAIVTRAIEPKQKAPTQAKRRKNRSTRDYLGPILTVGLRATPSDSPLLKALGEALLEIKPERFSAFNASTDPRDKEGCLVSLVRCAADHNNVARVREAAARVKHRFSSQPDAIFGPRSPYCQPEFIREITEELGVVSG